MTRILVVNCNTDAGMTARIARIAGGASSPGTEIVPVTPPFGPSSAEGYYESYIAAAGMLAAVEAQADPFDAIVLAGFGEHGREAMRQRWPVPVVDITEAGPMLANLVAHRYGVVTTLTSTLPLIRESLRNAGLDGRCAGVRASELPVSATDDDAGALADALEPEARALLATGADAIVLGCAGFAGVDAELGARLGVPVIDGVAAAVRLAEVLIASSLSTSKAGAFRPPDAAKAWLAWPPQG